MSPQRAPSLPPTGVAQSWPQRKRADFCRTRCCDRGPFLSTGHVAASGYHEGGTCARNPRAFTPGGLGPPPFGAVCSRGPGGGGGQPRASSCAALSLAPPPSHQGVASRLVAGSAASVVTRNHLTNWKGSQFWKWNVVAFTQSVRYLEAPLVGSSAKTKAVPVSLEVFLLSVTPGACEGIVSRGFLSFLLIQQNIS